MLRALTRIGRPLSRRLASSNLAPSSAASEFAPESVSKPDISLELFEDLKERIHGNRRSLDKITVTVTEADGKRRNYAMNRHDSTPLSCAKHISSTVAQDTALAIVTYPSGTVQTVSPVARFDQDCELEFIRFNTIDANKAALANQAFWRSASVVIAAVLDGCFPGHNAKPNFEQVETLYFSASVENITGDLSESLKEIQSRVNDLIVSPAYFDSITVPESIAKEYGLEPGLQLCKLKNYVCELDGPVIGSPSQISKFKLIGSTYCEQLLNIGGAALPYGQKIPSYHWDLICQEARKKFIM